VLARETSSEFDEAESTEGLERYEILSSMEINAAGLLRYWRKRAEREAGAAGGS
jgi:hypothetical protein